MKPLRVIYDGECPFCSSYVRLVRLRENFDVELIDARQEPNRANSYGLDLNEGMIADLDGDVHHGADAVWLLSSLSSRSGVLNGIMAVLFSWSWLARVSYPALRFSRNMTLKALRRHPLKPPSKDL